LQERDQPYARSIASANLYAPNADALKPAPDITRILLRSKRHPMQIVGNFHAITVIRCHAQTRRRKPSSTQETQSVGMGMRSRARNANGMLNPAEDAVFRFSASQQRV